MGGQLGARRAKAQVERERAALERLTLITTLAVVLALAFVGLEGVAVGWLIAR
jgi:hypothetical protein